MTLREIRERLPRAAILLDYDGTLAPIVARPEDALPAPGAADVLAGLLDRAGSVTVVTGRPAAFIKELICRFVAGTVRLERIGVPFTWPKAA